MQLVRCTLNHSGCQLIARRRNHVALREIVCSSWTKTKLGQVPRVVAHTSRGGLIRTEELDIEDLRFLITCVTVSYLLDLYIADVHKRVGVFSLEMSNEQVVQRLVSAETGIDSQRLRLGNIHEDEWSTLVQATSLLSDSQIYIDDTPAISALEMRTKARRLHAEDGLDMLIVDYLQLMRGDFRSENRVQEISFISRSLKGLARELNIPVVALSQLSRAVESRHDKRPMLSDLRESGSIEQDADVVMFVYRDEIYNPDTEFPSIAELRVAKHRSGPTGIFSVYFKKELAQFVDLEIRREPLEY